MTTTESLLILVGLLQFGIYIFQAFIMSKQADIQKRQMDIQVSAQRPNIFVRGIDRTEFSFDANVNIHHIFQTVWHNSGLSPPTLLKVGDKFTLLPDDSLPLDFDYSVSLRQTIPLGRDMEVKFDPRFLTDAEMLAIISGRRRLFFWGKGEYNDDLDRSVTHCVEFCYRTDVQGKYLAFLPFGPHNRTFDRLARN